MGSNIFYNSQATYIFIFWFSCYQKLKRDVKIDLLLGQIIYAYRKEQFVKPTKSIVNLKIIIKIKTFTHTKTDTQNSAHMRRRRITH